MGVVSRFQIPPDLSVAQVVEHTPTFFLNDYDSSAGRAIIGNNGVPVVRFHL